MPAALWQWLYGVEVLEWGLGRPVVAINQLQVFAHPKLTFRLTDATGQILGVFPKKPNDQGR
jgi:hypothetical protein